MFKGYLIFDAIFVSLHFGSFSTLIVFTSKFLGTVYLVEGFILYQFFFKYFPIFHLISDDLLCYHSSFFTIAELLKNAVEFFLHSGNKKSTLTSFGIVWFHFITFKILTHLKFILFTD